MEIHLAQIVFQIINFGIVFGALSILLYKPILKIFEERARRIEEGQKAARNALEQQEKIDELKNKTEQKLKKKRAEVLEEAVKEAQEQKKQLIEEARHTAEAEITSLKTKWEQEKAKEKAQMQSELVEVVIAATEKILQEKIDSKKHSALIDSELNQLLKAL